MKLQGGCNKVQPGRLIQQSAAGEVAARGEIAALEVPGDPEPIVKRLQRKVDVLAGFEFEDGEPAVTVAGEEVDQIAVGGGEGGHLAVHSAFEAGDQLFEMVAHLALENLLGLGGTGEDGRGVLPWAVERGVDVAAIAQVDGVLEGALVIDAQKWLKQIGVEMFQTEGGGDVAACRDEESEPFDGETALALAQMVEPDEAEGEHMVGLEAGWGEYRGPGRLAFRDQRAREGGREGVLEIGASGELAQRPARELAGERAAELLAGLLAKGLTVGEAIGAGGAVGDLDVLIAAEEAFGFETEAVARLADETSEAEDRAAGVVPDVELDNGALGLEREAVGAEGEGQRAFVDEHGVPGGVEEGEDRLGEGLDGIAGDGHIN